MSVNTLPNYAEQLVRGRRAVRSFRPEPVPEETLARCSLWPVRTRPTPTPNRDMSRWPAVIPGTASARRC
jgi:anti-sigma factor RsiW